MKDFLVETFNYNDWANLKILDAISHLPEKEEAVELFSHLISSQNKWMNRISQKSPDHDLAWLGPVYEMSKLETEWKKSLSAWLNFIEAVTESELESDIKFKRPSDGRALAVSIKDIVLQLNFHSIHHRAQINKIIRKQGFDPPQTDYILKKIREV